MRSALAALLVLLATAARAQPEPVPLPPAITTPRDTKLPGPIALAIDATDLNRHILRVSETIPVAAAGDAVLLFPKWLPGDHGPDGPLAAFAGLVLRARGKRIDWVRDVVDVNAFHVQVPAGVTSLDATFQFLSPPNEHEGRVTMSTNIIDLQWNTVLLYPAGFYTRDIAVSASVKLPRGWQFASALEAAATIDSTTTFKPVTLNVLMDSPLYAGRYFNRIDLDPGAAVPVRLNVVADRPEDLAISPADLQAHRNLVQQAYKTFGSHHYDHYDFLLLLSGEVGGIGLEHHRSSENGVDRSYFTDPAKSQVDRDLLPHEYTHSWNGKFRRPADLYSPDFNEVPERDSLLWVYEGQTEYWGQVLAARSGLLKPEQVLDVLAGFAADKQFASAAGRSWRALQDTTNDPVINERRPLAWRSYSRAEDYYVEGLLMWLDADTLIRERSNGQRSLNDFARAFFGINDGSFTTVTYSFADVVKALNDVEPYDWAAFLRRRLDGHGPGAPLDGLARGGYRLVFTDTKSAYEKAEDTARKSTSFAYSLGIAVGEGGAIETVDWDTPAFKAGLTKGGRVVAVNGLAYEDAGDLEAAIKVSRAARTPLEMLVQDGKHFRVVRIDYYDGLRFPHLERMPGSPGRLDDILAPLK